MAYSDGDRTSRIGGAVVRTDRVVDGLAFDSCTVGELDSTDAVLDLYDRLDREDVQYLLSAGVAPAWFNLVDLRRVHRSIERPVLAVSFESSPGLGPALRREFDGDALDERLAVYERLPPRHPVDGVDGELFVRACGVNADEAIRIVRELTSENARPEPTRVAKVAARGYRDAASACGDSDDTCRAVGASDEPSDEREESD